MFDELEKCSSFRESKKFGYRSSRSGGTRPYCPICHQDFYDRQVLKRHMDRHNRRRQTFQCDVCSKTFLYAAGLYRHRKQHGGAPVFQCPLCQKTFVYSLSLTSHLKNNHSLY
ncbi:zinc finger protein 438-like isoform X2 [Tachypleus tridentatus]|uniref:zinc finger protein 438-like isoform X2 n=1 Tax=Tachypleus tridentatus TaxID=6853 RepID=UPI003FCF81DF